MKSGNETGIALWRRAVLPALLLVLAGIAVPATAADTCYVRSVVCDSYYVSAGQTVFVQVGIAAGDTNVIIQSADSVAFIITDTYGNRYDTLVTATLYSPVLPLTIAKTALDTITYAVAISSAMCTRAVQLDASCTGYIDSGGVRLLRSDTRADRVDTWVVQAPAVVSFVRLSLNKDTGLLNPGAAYDTVVLQVCLYNSGQGTAVVTVDTTKVVVTNSAGVAVTSLLAFETWPVSPRRITGGAYDTLAFTLRLPDTRSQGVLGTLRLGLLGAGLVVTDSNSGAVLTVTRTADTPSFTTYYPLRSTVAETVYACDSNCWLYIPADKLGIGTAITIIKNPTSASITAADNTLASMATWEGVPATSYEVSLTRAADTPTLETMLLNIRYGDMGMTAREESSLRIMRLNGSSWELLTTGNTPLTTTNIAQVLLGRLSIFRCIITDPVSSDLNRVKVYPNPFVPYDDDANTGVPYTGAVNTGITFTGLTGSAKIQIFTLDGILVDAVDATNQGNWQWDARNSAGQECASGIYLYMVTDGGGGLAKGKLCIIR